jgi:PhzF family phenazine biosynthesis protein
VGHCRRVTPTSEPLIVPTTVFALSTGGGNPCPVVLDADALSVDQMQSVAAAAGHETGCVVRSTRADADIRLRYFVPNHEMEMCVHATIGAVTVLRERGVVVADTLAVETAIGIVHVTVGGSGDAGSPTIRVEQRVPEVGAVDLEPAEVARVLGLDPGSIDPRLPIEGVSTARSKLMVPLRDHHALDAIDPRLEELWALCDRVGTTGVYAFTTTTRNGAAVAEARQFPVRAGYPEDPATGVAACALGAYLSVHTPSGAQGGERSFRIEQGHAMGRPSVLVARTLVEDALVRRTWIEGSATVDPPEAI